jgi:hypothetical protein
MKDMNQQKHVDLHKFKQDGYTSDDNTKYLVVRWNTNLYDQIRVSEKHVDLHKFEQDGYMSDDDTALWVWTIHM